MSVTKKFLLQTLTLAQQGKGQCYPNPAVGCVIVKNEKMIATGFHAKAGNPHAEVMALQQLSPEQASLSEVYISLEPCCHFGKTPPCTDLLIRSKVKKVFYAHTDPNPAVTNNSKEILQQAGIQCEQIIIPEIENFYKSYDYWQQHKLPYCTAKLALSLDGKIAEMNGKPIALTGKEAALLTHQQRKLADAILTTAKTVINDDPALNARLSEKHYPKLIFVIDRNLTISSQAKIFTHNEQVIIFHDENLKPQKNYDLNKTKLVPIKCAQNQLMLTRILQYIGEMGIHDLWIEAGGILFSALINQGLLQHAYLYIAPKFVGKQGLPALQPLELSSNLPKTSKWGILGSDAVCELGWE